MVMDALLNIGLLRNTGGFVKCAEVEQLFDTYGVVVHKARVEVAEPGTQEEDTFILHVSGWDEEKAFSAAWVLDQDCIAQYDLGECEGALIGPQAAKWGKFDAKYFKLL
jgi:hypothetical protein